MHYTSIALAALASLAAAQDSSMSICDKYTTALLMDNTPSNQKALLTQLVNTAVIGNYVKGNKTYVPGILAMDATYMGRPVNLAKYFDGSMASSNRNGMATAVNFLDGGGATPLMNNTAGDDPSSNQYMLLTHLYSYFGLLLQCSGVGKDGFEAYGGSGSQYNVHKYMDLDEDEFSYFVTQVGLSAASFGVTQDDITAAGNALTMTFGQRCAAPATVDPSQGAQEQSICQDTSCPMAQGGTCPSQAPEPTPTSSGSSSGGSSSTPASSASGSMAATTGAATSVKASTGLLGGVAAAAWMLL